MKKILVLLIVFMCFPMITNAVSINSETLKNFGGSAYDSFSQFKKTKDGGYISVGKFSSTDINGLTKKGDRDGFVIKYDDKMNEVWKKSYSKSKTVNFNDVIETSSGDFIVVGNYVGNSYTQPKSGIIIKYDKNGNMICDKNTGDLSGDTFMGVIETSDNNYLVSGSLSSASDAIFVKYDGNGNVLWRKEADCSAMAQYFSSVETKEGDYIVVGMYTNGKNSHDGVVAKYDKNGNRKWLKTYGGTSMDWFTDVILTDDGGFIAVGQYMSQTIGDLQNKGYYDAVAVKYNSNGEIVWEYDFGALNEEHFSNIIKTSDGNYLLSGHTSSSEIPGLKLNGKSDFILIKLDKDGNAIWETAFGGNEYDSFSNIVELEENKFVAFGSTDSTNLNNLTLKGSTDGLIMTFNISYDVKVLETQNGNVSYDVKDYKVLVTTIPDKGYTVDEIKVVDGKGKDVVIKKNKDNEYEFDLYNDVNIEVKFKKEYNVKLNEVKNGTVTFEKIENGKGRIKVVPNEKFKFDKLIIKDSSDNNVQYEEKDGYYYFDIVDDLNITVNFVEMTKEEIKDEKEEQEEIENPKTADMFIYYSSAIVCTLFGIWSVEQYRKTRRVS